MLRRRAWLWQEVPTKLVARLSVILCVLVFSTALPVSQSGTIARPQQVPLLYTVAREYQPTAWLNGAERFPGGAAIFISDATGRLPLVPGFAATADADVSFDGGRVLFAGKQRPGDRWQIWEVSVPGGHPRQVTSGDADYVRPLYVQPDAMVYARNAGGAFVMEIAPLGASDQKRLPLTYAPGSFLPTDVLRDGRVLFEAASPAAGRTTSELYTVYSDGSGVEAYRCDHGASRYSGKQLPSGDVVFARDGSLARFTSAFAHDVAVAAPAGNYAGDPVETKDGVWLVSWRAAAQNNFELRKWTPGAAALQPHIVHAGANVVEPALVKPRPVPNRHPSGLHDWSYANVLCLNAYTSKHQFADGSIASARLYTRDASGAPRLLGTAPVEKDGSFFVRVPGDQPLRIELLDSSGRSLHGEAGWFWMRRGEQRVCVGCHAGPETAPENAVPAILLRSTVPADLTMGNKGS